MHSPILSAFGAAVHIAALCISSLSFAEPLDIVAYSITLDPSDPGRTQFDALQWRGGFELHSSNAQFGGLSALEFPDATDRFVALSDLGFRIDGRLIEVQNRPIAFIETTIAPLQNRHGGRLGDIWRDAESLAADGAGGVFVAFEGQHRVLHYPAPSAGTARLLETPQEMQRLPRNEGIEAMTRLCDGRLLLIAEHPDATGHVPAWAGNGTDGAWTPLRYPVSDEFVPTGAATLPDCRIAVLERRFSLLGGFAARIRRLDLIPDAERDLTPVTLARIAPPMLTDNFEAIATRRSASGETLLYILSDDNYISLERTLLLVFALPPAD
ncbi:MAG: esterase-like activity of phytase family protein [Alphaproteobacteria bacterium]